MVRHWRSASGAQGARQPGRDLEGPTVTVDVAQAWAADEQRRHEDDTVGEVLPANQINQIAEPGSSFGNWVQATRRPAWSGQRMRMRGESARGSEGARVEKKRWRGERVLD